MKPGVLFSCLLLGTLAGGASGEETFDEAMARATVDYAGRLKQASAELTAAREGIAREKAPLIKTMRAAEDRIIAAEDEVSRLETARDQSVETRRRLIRDAELLHKNSSYYGTLSHESLKAFADGFTAGEEQFFAEETGRLLRQLEDPATGAAGVHSLDGLDFLLARVQQSMGGYTVAGRATLAQSNLISKGTFAFAGPETYFRPEEGGASGTIRARDGTALPVLYELADWKTEDVRAFFQGQLAMAPADASGGKALRLKETQGTIWTHIRKGGLVAFAIIGVGFLSLLLIIRKLRDLAGMRVDQPAAVTAFLAAVSGDSPGGETQALDSLRATTRELFAVGLRHRHEPKLMLEERLQAVLLRQRLHFERWLPLLAVIATASPLMGLLGTVVGMVKTFALITVFGTGDAGKLSSGISEVLVATELGLMVAIPTLIVHGFLTHRIQKNLSLLERYALEFVTAVELNATRGKLAGKPEAELVP